MTAIRRPRWWFALRDMRRAWARSAPIVEDLANAAMFLLIVAAVSYCLLASGGPN